MSVARTARRRRKQAKMGFKHMAPLKRPHYPAGVDAATSARREFAFRERQKRIAARKGRK